MSNGPTAHKPAPSLWLSSSVCFLASLFYLYEFCLQVSPGVMTHQLMSAYNIGAIGVGTISAFYYYAYTPMQLPAGILYDRFGPRKLIPIATIVCALGALFFSSTHSIVMASYGRFMMGFGSAFSFIGTLLLISRWFPAHYFAVLAGIAQSMSSVGAVFGEAPLSTAISHFGWRQSMLGLSVIGIILAVFIWVVVRDYPAGHEAVGLKKRCAVQSFKGLSRVVSSKQTWCVAVYAFMIWAPVAIFGALWGVPFIAERFQTSTTMASVAVSMIWIGLGIGSPAIGWVSEKFKLRCIPLGAAALIGVISTFSIVYVPDMSFTWAYILLFCFGLAAAGQSLSFASIKDVTEPKYVGTAVGFNNMAVVAGGALFQPLVGYFLHIFWDGSYYLGVPHYSVSAYQKALWILPVCYLGSLLISWIFIRETHCKQIYQSSEEEQPMH